MAAILTRAAVLRLLAVLPGAQKIENDEVIVVKLARRRIPDSDFVTATVLDAVHGRLDCRLAWSSLAQSTREKPSAAANRQTPGRTRPGPPIKKPY